MNVGRVLSYLGLTILSFWMISGSWTMAQNDTTRHAPSAKNGGSGYISLGYQVLEVDPVNQRLQQAPPEYTTLPDRFVSFGGGGHVLLNSWLIGGEGHGFSGSRSAPHSYRVNVDGGYGFFNLGYRFSRLGLIDIAPIVGVGGGSVEMTLSSSLNNPSFNEITAMPERQSTLTSSSFLVKVSTELSHEIRRGSKTKESGSTDILTLHLRAGYIFGPLSDKWEMNGETVSDGPSSGLKGAFFRISVGFGGYEQRSRVTK